MASILNEYLNNKMGLIDLQTELQSLILKYNQYTKRYLFVYASDINKSGNRNIDISLVQDDFYNIQDILREINEDKIDFLIQTPGGSGEAAEEIARFLRKKFEEVNFIIPSEAKSAGTILALSGDNIYMTDTGSLGPIDAQVKMRQSVVSAHDYIEWVEATRKEALRNGCLNPFDAQIIANISPGELHGVINALEFAKDLVKSWLEEYKFKNWEITRDRKEKVTPEMRKTRAEEVATILCDHTAWRSHGRSLKIEDLSDYLIIERIDDDKELSDIVYRLKTIIRMIFDSSTIFKIFTDKESRLFKSYSVSSTPNAKTPLKSQNSEVEAVEVNVECPRCNKKHTVVGFLDIEPDKLKEINIPIENRINSNGILICKNCGYSIDMKPLKNDIEIKTKRKVNFK